DLNPDTPKPVSFTVKETVCPRTTRQPPEQCDFKENGLVKECAGTVTLDQDTGYYDVVCEELSGVPAQEPVRKAPPPPPDLQPQTPGPWPSPTWSPFPPPAQNKDFGFNSKR
uniref:Uncharacterized protein n=1 Tax=Myotis lucifugus TaxID=59463 RepID=G1Q810_MYOLU